MGLTSARDFYRVDRGVQEDHVCFDHWAHTVLNEGDDCVVQQCDFCGRVRHEPDGRVMAWFICPPGSEWPVRYAIEPGDRTKPTEWKHVRATPERTDHE